MHPVSVCFMSSSLTSTHDDFNDDKLKPEI